MLTCSSCGAAVSSRDETCSYCQATNPAYQAPAVEIKTLLAGALGSYEIGNHAAAADLFKHILALDDKIFEPYFYLADIYMRAGDYPAAVQAMQKAHDLRPGNPALHFNLGALLDMQEQVDEARRYYQEALQLVDHDRSQSHSPEFRQRIVNAIAALDDKPDKPKKGWQFWKR